MNFEEKAKSVVDQIFNEANLAILTLIKTSKSLPILVKRQKILKYHEKCEKDQCVLDFEWPSIDEFTVDFMIERIKEFIKQHWNLLTNNISIEVNCDAECTIENSQLYHFRAILRRISNVNEQTLSATSTIYFLVELSASMPLFSIVKVSHRIVNAKDSLCHQRDFL